MISGGGGVVTAAGGVAASESGLNRKRSEDKSNLSFGASLDSLELEAQEETEPGTPAQSWKHHQCNSVGEGRTFAIPPVGPPNPKKKKKVGASRSV